MNRLNNLFKPATGHAAKVIAAHQQNLEAMHTPEEVHAAKTRDYARRATIIYGCRDVLKGMG